MAYVTVDEMRAEGVTASEVSSERLALLIRMQSQFIEHVTGRFFEPRTMTLTLDGRGGKALLLGHPIIAIESIAISIFGSFAFDLSVDLEDVAIYNRHLTQGLLHPDDRNNPKVEFRHGSHYARLGSTTVTSSLIFPRGQQNVQVVGTFGYTDPDPEQDPDDPIVGITPLLIKQVCKMLVMRVLPRLTDPDASSSLLEGRIISESTRDQSWTMGTPNQGNMLGIFTGDPAIDSILLMYKRPLLLGSA